MPRVYRRGIRGPERHAELIAEPGEARYPAGMGAAPHPERWTPRRIRAAVVFSAFLAGIQVLVPLSRVLADRPIRFGWHMYAHGPDRVAFRVIGPEGVAETTSGGGFFARRRPEIRVEKWVPEALCAEVPGARRVEVEIEGRALFHHECD